MSYKFINKFINHKSKMLQVKQRIESMLFDHETTYRSDYPLTEIREYPKTVYKQKPSTYKRGVPEYRNIHTMTSWKGEMPAFSLLYRPKDIIRTDPNIVQERYEKIALQNEEAIRTRPRLVMTPAVSMDDVASPRARSILCADMYATSTQKAFSGIITAANNLKAELPGKPARSNLIALPKPQPSFVSPEWRMDSVKWDDRQLRAYCHPTREFWLRREPTRCKACEETALHQTYRRNQK